MSIMWVDKQQRARNIPQTIFFFQLNAREKWYVEVFTIENELLDATRGGEGREKIVDNRRRTMAKEFAGCK